MLVLSRKTSQAIIIGDNAVKITVVKISQNKVRLGIEADGQTIHREEIFAAISDEGGQPGIVNTRHEPVATVA